MIKYVLKQNHNEKSAAYGKYYAFPVVEETMDLEDLAHHMEEHNTGFSEAMCVGVMKAMVKCIKEQLLAGKNVKIDNLAIFSVGLRNKEGAVSPEEFTVANNISGVKLRARATGTLSNANLNLAASIRKANIVMGGTPGGGSDNSTNGSQNQGTTGSGTTGSGSGTQGSGTDSGNTGSGTQGSGTDSGNTGSGTLYTLSISSADASQGSVDTSVNKQYSAGSRVTIKATPQSGYAFDKWSDGSSVNPRNITLNQDITLTAIFKTATVTPPGEDDDDSPFDGGM